MQIRRCAGGVEVLAPAKVNIFFEVLSRRGDGFHEIETLMVPIRLFDTLSLEDNPSGTITISIRRGFADRLRANCGAAKNVRSIDSNQQLPQGEQNIAVRAVRLLAERAAVDRGARLHLVKRIPIAAGLGGGSSDAAAALAAANLVWQLNWPAARLASLAAELGSDIPFFFAGGPAICRGRGERIETVEGLPPLHLTIALPPLGLRTADVYRACRPANRPVDASTVLNSLRNNHLGGLGPTTHNRLQDAACQLGPWIKPILQALAEQNCPAIGMSGSGSSCFAICRSARHAASVIARLRAKMHGSGRFWAVNTM